MNTDSYPFTLWGVSLTVALGALFTVAMWPLLNFFGTITGTGAVGGVAVGIAVTVILFYDTARFYGKQRERRGQQR